MLFFKKLLSWPNGVEIQVFMEDFKQFCGLPNVQGAIDGTHIIIFKPLTPFLKIMFTIKHKVFDYCTTYYKL
jgi:hypothetical protein